MKCYRILKKTGKLDYDSNILVTNNITNLCLNRIGFKWGKIDKQYIMKFIKDIVEKGYLGD